MPSSKVREIPIFRETDHHHQPHPSYRSTASPTNCPPAREIPIQRDTGVRGRPFSDFFRHQDRDWGSPWPNHRGSFNSEMFDNDPFPHSSGFHSRSGFAGYPSHVGDDYMGDRRHSPVQKPLSKQPEPGDFSSPQCAESSLTISHPAQQPVEAETMPVSPPDLPKQSVPIFVEPAVAEPASLTNEMEAKNDATNGSLHVEEPPQRTRSPSPVPPNMTALEVIEQVLLEAARLKEEVAVYTGGRKEKLYLRLEELLTRLMLKLDRVESEGRDDIRNARREAVHTIQSVLELLESRTSETSAKGEPPSAESGKVPENSSSDTMIASDSASETNVETSCTEDSPRDAEQTDNIRDAAAVKEMVLGSEVPC